MVGLEDITYAGNHGLEILHRDGSKFVHPMPPDVDQKVKKLHKELEQEVSVSGVFTKCMNNNPRKGRFQKLSLVS